MDDEKTKKEIAKLKDISLLFKECGNDFLSISKTIDDFLSYFDNPLKQLLSNDIQKDFEKLSIEMKIKTMISAHKITYLVDLINEGREDKKGQ